ncbi:hypothetical protein D3C87_1466710 [compost metagenome]
MVEQADDIGRSFGQRGKIACPLHVDGVIAGMIDRRDDEAGIRQRRRGIPMAEIRTAETVGDDDERILPIDNRAITHRLQSEGADAGLHRSRRAGRPHRRPHGRLAACRGNLDQPKTGCQNGACSAHGGNKGKAKQHQKSHDGPADRKH